MKNTRNITNTMVLILLSFLLASCSSLRPIRQCSYNLCYSIRVPQGCLLAHDFVGEEEEDVIYLREDSACIYVSSSHYPPNQSNIKILADSIVKLRFQRNDVIMELDSLIGYEKFPIRPDTFELHGIDSNGMYWKDIIYDYPNGKSTMHSIGISIGYYNVPKADKELFDKALSTFVNKRKYE